MFLINQDCFGVCEQTGKQIKFHECEEILVIDELPHDYYLIQHNGRRVNIEQKYVTEVEDINEMID